MEVNTAHSNGETYEMGGFEGGVHIKVYEGRGVHLGLAWENEWQRAPKYVDTAFATDFHPLIQQDLGPLSLLFNPIFEKDSIGADSWGGSYSFQALYNWSKDHSAGLEFYSGVGEFKGMRQVHEQGHYIMPVVNWGFGAANLSVGPGIGLTAGSDRVVAKFNLSYVFSVGCTLVPSRSVVEKKSVLVTIKQEIPMRSIQWLGIPLTAIFLFLGGCGGGGSSGTTPQPPSALNYTTGTAMYAVGAAITPNRPRSGGGAVTSYSVKPDVPAGLTMSNSTGVITGTPTVVTATASYVVTASNSAGSTTATLTITVNAGAAGIQFVPNMNRWITPLSPQGSQFQALDTGLTVNGNPWLAGQAVSSVVNRNTLLVLTSGYNRIYNIDSSTPSFENSDGMLESTEYVFIYDISSGTPVFKQVVTNSYNGITFDPTRNDVVYVSSGMGNFPFAADGKTFPVHGNPPFYDSVRHALERRDATLRDQRQPEQCRGSGAHRNQQRRPRHRSYSYRVVPHLR